MNRKRMILFFLLLLVFPLKSQTPDLIPFRKGDKWGYCDKNKNIKVPLKYDDANPFHDGLAIIALKGKLGIIDLQGNEITPIKYNYISKFIENYALVCIEENTDTESERIIIKNPKTETDSLINKIAHLYGMDENKINKKYGFINKNGIEIIPCQYLEAGTFSEGLSYVLLPSDSTFKYGFINKNGSTAILPIFDNVNSFSEGLASVNFGGKGGGIIGTERGKNGYINFESEIVIPSKYTFAGDFKNGIAIVDTGKGFFSHYYGLINKKGEVVVPTVYFDIKDSTNGLFVAAALDKTGGRIMPNPYYGFINIKNDTIIPFKYIKADPFYEGLARIMSVDFVTDKLHKVIRLGYYGFIDNKDNKVIKAIYKNAYSFSEGLTAVQASYEYLYTEKWGFLDKIGLQVIPCIYDSVHSFKEGMAAVKNSVFGVLSIKAIF